LVSLEGFQKGEMSVFWLSMCEKWKINSLQCQWTSRKWIGKVTKLSNFHHNGL